MTAAISIQNLTKSYGDTAAIRGISLDVPQGELFGLIGPDGAGKTSTMRILTTLLTADAGVVRVNGFDPATERGKIRASVGYMPQRFSLYPDLSVEQNLDFFADIFGVPHADIAEHKTRLYAFSRLEEFKTRLAGRLSGGMKQKLALSCALIHDPALLVLDEPTTGVDPVSRRELWSILHSLRERGTTVFVSTPYMDEALQCGRIAVMHQGVLLAHGTPADIISSFPLAMYNVRSMRGRADEAAIRALPGVRSVHAFGESLHVAVDPATSREEMARRAVTLFGSENIMIPLAPSLEDVFINLIEAQNV